jgi:hypothetical protein
MRFPDTVEEFMEQYKMTDTKQVYSNGTEYVPIFRMEQWFEHEKAQLFSEDATKDAISRQAALDALDKRFDNIPMEQTAEILMLRKDLRELPTIQPEVLACGNGELVAKPEPQWILCDERMPEEHEWLGTKKFGTTISDEVYVTFENEKGERFCQHMKFQNGELSRYDQFHMDTWFKGSKPIAWMPLPKPFEGRTDEIRTP